MNQLNRFRFYGLIVLFLGLLAMSPSGQSYEIAESDFWVNYFEVEVSTGLAIFPDLPAPTSSYFDGTKDLNTENSSHVGIPVVGKIKYQLTKKNYESYLYADGKYITGLEGGKRLPGASFVKVGLGIGAAKNWMLEDLDFRVAVEAGYERSSFLSISRSHYFNALQTRLLLDMYVGDWNLHLSGAVAPWAQVNYYQDSGNNGYIKGSDASIWQFGSKVGYEISQDTFLFLGSQIERFQFNVENSFAYESFGLNIIDFRESNELNRDLWVFSYLIGLQKSI